MINAILFLTIGGVVKKDGKLWDYWCQKKLYDNPKLKRYYHIRNRNFHWLTSLSYHLVDRHKSIRILKTDLWNEAKKNETFFIHRKEDKVGIDVSMKICCLAKAAHPDIPIVRGTIGDLPFLNNSFDLIWDISTIDHFNNPEKVIKEYYQALTPGGALLLVFENPFCVSYPITKVQSLIRRHVPFKTFLPHTILKICKRTGFKIIHSLKTNIHLPTIVTYPLEKRGTLEKINREQNFFWQFFKKYFVILARKST